MGGGGEGLGEGKGAKCQVSRAPPVKEQQVGLVSTLRTGACCAGLVGLTSSAYAVLDRSDIGLEWLGRVRRRPRMVRESPT